MMIGMVVVECVRKDLVGIVIGFVGLFSYFGVVLVSYFMLLVIEVWGWEGFFCLIIVVVVVISL